jgi:hypothetical protein
MVRLTSGNRISRIAAAICAPLSWSFADRARTQMNGLASTRAYCGAAAAAVQGWATQFELELHLDPTPGTIRFDGEIHGLEVKVWAITDTDTFTTAVRQMLTR